MNNTRFATAIHILTILAGNDGEWLSSDWIAGSININPVIIRKEIIVLKKAGLVESRKGKEGGVRLCKKAQDIAISDIYKAVRNSDVLGKKNHAPNPDCAIGKNINAELEVLFRETDLAVERFLGRRSLKDFSEKFR